MTERRHSLKILGLSVLAAIGLVAVTASTAHASGEFTLEGSLFTSKGLANESFSGTGAKSTLLVPNIGLEITCTSSDVANGVVSLGGKLQMTLLFLGCVVVGNKFCTIYPSEMDAIAKTNSGSITFGGSGELQLMGSKHYLLFTTPFSSVYFEGALCTLLLGNVITGSMVFEMPTALTALVNQTLVPLSLATGQSLFGDALKFNAEPAGFDGGTVTVQLSGVNKGKTWGAE